MDDNKPNAWQRISQLNPAVLRGILVGLFGVVTLVTGKAIDDSVIDTVCNVILLILPVIAGIFIRRAVTPNAKVIAFQPNPIDEPHVIEAGEATILPGQDEALIDAAHSVPKAA